MEALGIQNFWEFLVGTIIIVLLPGPNSLYVVTASAQTGHRAGWWAAAGIFTGDSLLMIATASGAASLIALFPTGFALVKGLGAIYLGWIGLQLARDALVRWQASHLPQPAFSLAHPYWRALLLSLTNPKAILFFLAFFTQFVRADAASVVLAYLALGIVVQVCSLLYLWLLIVAGVRLRNAFSHHPRWASAGLFCVGVFFLVFALKMLLG